MKNHIPSYSLSLSAFWGLLVLVGGIVSPLVGYSIEENCTPCAREGGFMGLNLGYCGGSVKNNRVVGMGSPLSLLDIEIPQGPTVLGRIFPEELQRKFHQNGFIVGIETGYDFKILGTRGKGWALGYFVNGFLSTARGSALFPGQYWYPGTENTPIPFEEKLRFRNKGFWSTGLRFGPLIQRMFLYVKGGFMMTRMSMSIQNNSLTRLVVPSRTTWFPGAVVGMGAEFQITPVFVLGLDLTANLCSQKQITVAFTDLNGAMFVALHPFYGQALLTLKYKFPLRTQMRSPSNTHSVYRPSW
ncbi:hypothetical protein [Holospora curviuscula]|nr:hypothetical protein [Holospora curviuscula]